MTGRDDGGGGALLASPHMDRVDLPDLLDVGRIPRDDVDDDGKIREEEAGRETTVRRCADIGAKEKAAATLPTEGRNGGGMVAAARAAATTTTTTTIAESDNGSGGDDDGLPRRILRFALLSSGTTTGMTMR